MSAARFLVVQAGGERVGLDLALVREVVDLAAPRPVPGSSPALRGVMQLRERHLSVLHLGSLLHGTAPPQAAGDTAVVVELAGPRPAHLALEVEGVEDVADRGAVFVGEAPEPWGSGVWQVGGDLVTLVDSEALVDFIGGHGPGAGGRGPGARGPIGESR